MGWRIAEQKNILLMSCDGSVWRRGDETIVMVAVAVVFLLVAVAFRCSGLPLSQLILIP